MFKPAVFAILAAFSVSAAAGGVYKWTDADGRIHYTDQPPPSGTQEQDIDAQISVTSFTGTPIISGSAAGNARARLKLYGTSWCGVCKRARTWLGAHNIPYDDYDVEASPTRMREFKNSGGKGYPLFVAGSATMRGFSAEGMSRFLGLK